MSVLFETKLALFDAYRARFSGTPLVLVTFADPGDNARKTGVWFAETVEDDLAPAAMSAKSAKPTNLEAELTVRALATSAASDPIAAERDVWAMVASLKTSTRDDVNPATIADLTSVRPLRTTVTNGVTASGEVAAQADLVLRVRARVHI